jgi:hypothetical protein
MYLRKMSLNLLSCALLSGVLSSAVLAAPTVVYDRAADTNACSPGVTICNTILVGGVGSSLIEPVAGFSVVPGFDGTFIRSGNIVRVFLTDLPAHNTLSLSFLFAAIDSWDGSGTFPSGDFFNVTVDGVSIYRETYSNTGLTAQTASTINRIAQGPIGFSTGGTVFNDSAYAFLLEGIAHSATTLTIDFFADGVGWQGLTNLGDESFGLEDIKITVDTRANNVPLPGSAALLGLGGLLLAGQRLKRRRLAC